MLKKFLRILTKFSFEILEYHTSFDLNNNFSDQMSEELAFPNQK